MTPRSPIALTAAALAALVLASCSSSPADAPADVPAADPAPTDEAGHGQVDGAEEVAEAPAHLLTVASDGTTGLLDLATEEQTAIGSIGSPSALASDGRYAFVTTDAGVEIVDSGMWTWDHGDHFHYYRASSALPGAVPGEGPAIVTTPPLATAGAAGILFTGSREAVSLDMDALSDGEIVERFRIPAEGTGGALAPVGDAMIAAFDDGSGVARVLDETGEPTGEEAACDSPSGAIVTRVGTVVGCADGALLAIASGGSVEIERIPSPDDVDAPRAEAFDGRKNRPDVAALAGPDGFWVLDTRAREWTHATTDADLVRISAASDADENVVALAADGSVRVYGPDGAERGATDPLVADPTSDGVSLVVDAQRAYVNAPDEGIVYEIAYADDARIARELTPDAAPDFATEAGR